MSFPRKRESRLSEFSSAAVLWIPACAGMTPNAPRPACHRRARRQSQVASRSPHHGRLRVRSEAPAIAPGRRGATPLP